MSIMRHVKATTQQRKVDSWAPYGGTWMQQQLDAGQRDRLAYGGLDATATGSRNRFMDLIGGGQQAAEQSAQGLFQSVLPQFQQGLQGLAESQIARGVTGGQTELGGTQRYVSDFSRNLANAMAGQATSVYGQQLGAAGDLMGFDRNVAEGTQNRYLDLLAGRQDYDLMRRDMKNQRRAGVIGGITGLAGIGLGGWLGGR